MARVCEICGKGKQNGNSVSHSNIKTKRSFNANLQNIRIEVNGTVYIPAVMHKHCAQP